MNKKRNLSQIIFFLLIMCFSLSAISQDSNGEMALFDSRGFPLYSLPEGDFSLLRRPIDNLVNSTFMAPQLEINGEQVPTGTVLVLETGETFVLREVLGAGFHTIVLRDFENRAIRLARHIDKRTMEMQTYFLEAALLLASVVESKYLVNMSEFQFRSDYVSVVEMLAVEQTLDEYLQSEIDSNDKIYQELLMFFSAFHRVKTLGSDFLPKQIGYVRDRGWVLFDYSPGVKILKAGEASNRPLNLINSWSIIIDEIGIDIDVLEKVEDDLRNFKPPKMESGSQNQRFLAPLCRRVF